jgi:hypothetical protein
MFRPASIEPSTRYRNKLPGDGVSLVSFGIAGATTRTMQGSLAVVAALRSRKAFASE